MTRSRRRPTAPSSSAEPFLRAVMLVRDRIPDGSSYPFSIAAVRALASMPELPLHPKVTFLVGENGAGKSTLIEAMAILAGFNPEGGTRNFRFAMRSSESELSRCLRPVRGARRERTGYFPR